MFKALPWLCRTLGVSNVVIPLFSLHIEARGGTCQEVKLAHLHSRVKISALSASACAASASALRFCLARRRRRLLGSAALVAALRRRARQRRCAAAPDRELRPPPGSTGLHERLGLSIRPARPVAQPGLETEAATPHFSDVKARHHTTDHNSVLLAGRQLNTLPL